MKKLFIFLILFFVATLSAEAKKIADYRLLTNSLGTPISTEYMSINIAIYSEAINVSGNVGFCTLLVIEDKSGGTGDIDISTEYSFNGTTFYPAYVSDMAGSLSAEGNIVTALQNTSRYISFTPRFGKYMRYKFDPDADSQVTAYHVCQEES